VSAGEEPKVVRGRPPKDASAPRGPDEVIEAVLRSGARLFAERGVGAVAVREVAADAGVNAGLVHRYVGAKDDLVRAVMQRISADLGEELEGGDDATYGDRRDATVDTYMRILAHLLLEGHEIEDLDLDFPLMRYVIDRLAAEPGRDERDARMRAVCVIALDIGWRLFEPLVSACAELDAAERSEVRSAIDETRRRIAAGA
jgi:TetR/AcrR family transcriptional regulator, repressor for neighboring sulfatase